MLSHPIGGDPNDPITINITAEVSTTVVVNGVSITSTDAEPIVITVYDDGPAVGSLVVAVASDITHDETVGVQNDNGKDDVTPGVPGLVTDATDGAGALTTLNVQAGDVITFSWSFDADDYLNFNDFGFVVIDGAVTKLSDIAEVGNYGSTPWATFSYTATSTGPLDIGFGVMNVGDTALDSHLLVDNLAVNGVVQQSFESGDLTGWTSTGTATCGHQPR